MFNLRQVRRQSEEIRTAAAIEEAVRNRYRHVLADLDATNAELIALESNGYTLTTDEMQTRVRRFRDKLMRAAGVEG